MEKEKNAGSWLILLAILLPELIILIQLFFIEYQIKEISNITPTIVIESEGYYE